MQEHSDALYSHLMDDSEWEWEWDYVTNQRNDDIISLMDRQFDAFQEKEKDEDMVNSPKHYTQGKMEAIDVIEDAIRHAPDPVVGMLQAQVLKYSLRCWHKGNAEQDLEKAQWYLKRLIKAVSNVESK